MYQIIVFLVDGSVEKFYIVDINDGDIMNKYLRIYDKDRKVYYINHDQIVEIRIEEHVE